MRGIFVGLGAVLSGLLALVIVVLIDSQGTIEEAGTIMGDARDAEALEKAGARQRAAAQAVGAPADKAILFGDLHVHSTFSVDAFLWSLPMTGGEGLHPPAEACDFARYCANLDFYSQTDHAESLTPRHWSLIKQTVRDCNARTDPENPDLVAFLGWEWTQIGRTPDEHFGHRNVVLLEQDEDKVPVRPIMAGGLPVRQMRRRTVGPVEETIGPYLTDFASRDGLQSLFTKQAALRAVEFCEPGVGVRELPADCVESATTPEQLWARLDEWGTPVMAIPHGTSWGYYTPPGVRWDKQLQRAHSSPGYQPVIEVFSGHGNSEEYRDWRAVEFGPDGETICPEPGDGYLPCCHRAGELIRERCEDPDSALCGQRVAKAEQDYLAAGVAGHLVVPGATPEDWLACGQCTDCTLPALNYRPGNSVQYIMALSNFDEPEPDGRPHRFRFGFIASSDNHNAQPGTGYKETGRHKFTDVSGATNPRADKYFAQVAKRKERGAESIPYDSLSSGHNLFQYGETERLGSFFYTGGLVAVHSDSRRREDIFGAIQQREVYATSGERMLLWFDLLNAPDGPQVMGSEVEMAEAPRFRVRAVGAPEQLPGCPRESVQALGAARLDALCGGECYNPDPARRRAITRIEVVRIRPQSEPGQPMAELIEDPWRVYSCAGDPAGCTVEFSDEEFADAGRDALYYVRALQAPTDTINGAQLRCTTTYDGECVDVELCHGDQRTPQDDDCLAPSEPRAWSSPIFVNHI